MRRWAPRVESVYFKLFLFPIRIPLKLSSGPLGVRAQFMVTSPEREQVKLQGKIGRWFTEPWALACPHLEAETTSAPTSQPLASKSGSRRVECL